MNSISCIHLIQPPHEQTMPHWASVTVTHSVIIQEKDYCSLSYTPAGSPIDQVKISFLSEMKHFTTEFVICNSDKDSDHENLQLG